MYNLIVSADDEAWEGPPFDIDISRVFEWTSENLKARFQQLDEAAVAELTKFPCIFAYERTTGKDPKYGMIRSIKKRKSIVRIEYQIEEIHPFLKVDDFASLEFNLDIDNKWEMRRTHWALKDINLHVELKAHGITLPAWNEGNEITTVTRQHIADEIYVLKLWPEGRLNEAEFLLRVFDLRGMPSRNDDRWNNAYDDIYQHTVNNNDWNYGWMYSDPRTNLLYCADETYLRFLSETLHPLVRSKEQEIKSLLQVYNKYLANDGYEIVQAGEISKKAIYAGKRKELGATHYEGQRQLIKKYLNTDYVSNQISIMTSSIATNTDIAIGTAKEFLETVCKSILKQKDVTVDPAWTLGKLVNETTARLDFTPKDANDSEKAERSVKQILGGLSSAIHGITELRNAYGSGHGKDAHFKGLEPMYAKLVVGVVSEIVLLYLTVNGETTELDKQP